MKWTPLLLLAACADPIFFRVEAPIEPIPDDPAAVSFFAIGDFGNGGEELAAVVDGIRAVRLRPKREGLPAPFVIELGDNIYPSGLADERPRAEKQLREVFAPFTDMVVHVIPGNHDYLGNLEHQRTTARELFGDRWSFHPSRGPPESTRWGPLEIFWVDSERMIRGALDEAGELERLVAASKAPWKIIATHHPIRSHGPHGGHFEWYDPQAPFRLAGVTAQDLSSDAYQAYAERIARLPVDAILSGHEHSLQLLSGTPLQIVSGSASEHTPVAAEADTLFAWSETGFVYLEAGEAQLFIAFAGRDGAIAHTHTVRR